MFNDTIGGGGNSTLTSCADVWSINSSLVMDRCLFIQDHCQSGDNLIDYTAFYFCTMAPLGLQLPAFLIMIGILAFLFTLLGITSGDFFCPNLSSISSILGLSETVAGVTLAAFGNGAPDIFSTFAALRADAGSLAIGELLGAALWVTLVVVGLICQTGTATLPRRPFLRDVVFLIFGVLILTAILSDGTISIGESVALLGYYLVYVAVVIVSHLICKQQKLSRFRLQPSEASINQDRIAPDLNWSVEDDEHYSNVPIYHARSFLPHLNSELLPFLATGKSSGYSLLNTSAPTPDLDTGMPSSSNVRDSVPRNPPQPVSKYSPWILTFLPELAVWSSLGWIRKTWVIISSPLMILLRLTIPVSHRTDLERVASISELSPTDANPLIPSSTRSSATVSEAGTLDEAEIDELDEDDEEDEGLPEIFRPGRTPVASFEIGGMDSPAVIFCVQLALFPQLCAVSFYKSGNTWHNTVVMIVSCVISLSLGIAGWIYVPKLFKLTMARLLAWCGFGMSIVWISTIANEVVALLQTFGLLLGVDAAVLGLTVFALGNSLGDMVTNYNIAKLGFPTMAMGACFGSPMMNILVGIGGTTFITCLTSGAAYTFTPHPTLNLLAVSLLVSLFITLAAIPISAFKIGPTVGKFLILEYGLIIVIVLIVK